MVGLIKIFEQDGDIVLVSTPFHVFAKVPLNTLHGESGAPARSSRNKTLAILDGRLGWQRGRACLGIWRRTTERFCCDEVEGVQGEQGECQGGEGRRHADQEGLQKQYW